MALFFIALAASNGAKYSLRHSHTALEAAGNYFFTISTVRSIGFAASYIK